MGKWIRRAREIRKMTMSYKIDTEELEREEMERVMVAESTVCGIMNSEAALEFHELSQVRVFAEMLRSSEEIEGIEIEMAPDFDLLLQFKRWRERTLSAVARSTEPSKFHHES